MRLLPFRRALLSSTALASIGAWALCSHALADEGWVRVAESGGIEAYQQEVPGRGLPRFRGVGEIEAEPAAILAVLDDVERACEWVPDCMESRILERESETRVAYYSRTDSPWPVADRDVVVRSETRIVPGPELTIERRFEAASEPVVAVPKGVERMKTMRGHYRLTAVAPSRTRVEYQVDADPGGSLPHALVRSASKENPIRTIEALRARVDETRGEYAEFLGRWPSPGSGAPSPVD